MKKLTIEQARRIIKNERDRRRRANKKFKEATKAGKRVIIAKDVIGQLKLGKIKAKQGAYLISDDLDDIVSKYDDIYGEDRHEAGDKEVCDILNDAGTCQACALGSVFVATVKIKDKLKVKDFADDYQADEQESMHKYLASIFSLKQLHMIENAFEGSNVNSLLKPGISHETFYACPDWEQQDKMTDDKLARACREFNEGVKDANKRLERIMQNVIDNDGTFKP